MRRNASRRFFSKKQAPLHSSGLQNGTDEESTRARKDEKSKEGLRSSLCKRFHKININ